jgi:nucleoside-diphosphate-sugar epimerase
MQTILGSGGAIGIETAKALYPYTKNIRLVSRNPKKINDSDELLVADITKKEEVMRAVEGSKVVYLMAGLPYNLKIWQTTWPKVMNNVIEACIIHGSKLVFFDNIYMVGGDNVNHITENSPISPVSKKGIVRANLDQMIMTAIEKGNLEAIIARSADFYGPFGSNSVLIELVYKNLIKDKKAQWFYNSKVPHSFTFTPDAAKATAILGNTSDAYNQVWNLPTDKQKLTGEDWIKMFASEMGKSAKYTLLPRWAVRLLGLFIPFLGEFDEMSYQYDRPYFFDSSKFEKQFNFKPTDPKEAIREIVKMRGLDTMK